MFFMAFIGTGIIICLATCVVCQAIPAIVHVHVHVVKSCLLFKFEFVQCSAWFFDQATGFVCGICPTRGCWNVFMAFIGTGILYVPVTCVVCQEIPAIVHV